MAKIILTLITGVLIIIGVIYFFVYDNSPLPEENVSDNQEIATTSTLRVSQPLLGISFAYLDGSEGYTLSEISKEMEADTNFLGGYTLIASKDVAEESDALERPPSLAIKVYANPNKNLPYQWAKTNMNISNIELIMGGTREAVVGGANAVRYTADGLYATDYTIVAHDSKIYLITGGYLDTKDAIRKDYEELLESVVFVAE